MSMAWSLNIKSMKLTKKPKRNSLNLLVNILTIDNWTVNWFYESKCWSSHVEANVTLVLSYMWSSKWLFSKQWLFYKNASDLNFPLFQSFLIILSQLILKPLYFIKKFEMCGFFLKKKIVIFQGIYFFWSLRKCFQSRFDLFSVQFFYELDWIMQSISNSMKKFSWEIFVMVHWPT